MTYTRPTASDPGTGGGSTDLTVVIDALSDGLEAVEAALPGKETAGAAASAVAAHEAAPDPHPGYATESAVTSALAGKSDTGHSHSYDPAGTAAAAVSSHEADTTSVHGIADTSALVLTSDGRLSDARTPTAHAASHLPGGSDALTTAAGSSQAFGDSAATGSAASFARSDHKHAMPADPKGLPLGLTGATAATRYAGATASGAPTSGTFAVGDYVVEQTGKMYVCTVAGTPGTWAQVGSGGGGNDFRSGGGAPGSGLGVDTDWYVDTSNIPNRLYGPKASGAWPTLRRALPTFLAGTTFAQSIGWYHSPMAVSAPWTVSVSTSGYLIDTAGTITGLDTTNNGVGFLSTGQGAPNVGYVGGRIATMPTEAGTGYGGFGWVGGSQSLGVVARVKSDGTLELYGLTTATVLAASAAGAVTAGRYVVLSRIGRVITAYVTPVGGVGAPTTTLTFVAAGSSLDTFYSYHPAFYVSRSTTVSLSDGFFAG